MNTVLWAFMGLVGCMFLIVVVVVAFSWAKAEETGKAKGRGEMVQECNDRLQGYVLTNARLKAENGDLRAKLANVPRQYLLQSAAVTPALPPGTEYTRTDKWKSLPQAAAPEGGQ